MTMETIDYIYELRREIEKDMINIPYFINIKSYTDKKVYEILLEMYVIISKLTQNKILTTIRMDLIFNEFSIEVDKLVNIAANETIYLLHNQLKNDINKYISICEEFELYEIAANFKNFNDTL